VVLRNKIKKIKIRERKKKNEKREMKKIVLSLYDEIEKDR